MKPRFYSVTCALIPALFLLLHSAEAQAQTPGTIWVVGGTYGASCGVPHGNVSGALARACNGRRSCTYTVNHKTIGDPKPGCGKDYLAEWRCIGSTTIHRSHVGPEAGYGKRVRLSCAVVKTAAPGQKPPKADPPPPSGGSIQVVAGTYGRNCGAPHGNKTAHLARACDGRRRCTYTINYRVIGDPKPGCSKNYIAEWSCPGSGGTRRAVAKPEAGFNKKVVLRCD